MENQTQLKEYLKIPVVLRRLAEDIDEFMYDFDPPSHWPNSSVYEEWDRAENVMSMINDINLGNEGTTKEILQEIIDEDFPNLRERAAELLRRINETT